MNMTPEEIIELIRQDSPEEATFAQRIVDRWRERFGEPICTPEGFCIVAEVKFDAFDFNPFAIQREGKRALYVYLQNIRGTPPFDLDENWCEFRRRLDDVPGADFKDTGKGTYSSESLSAFSNNATLDRFFELIEWSISQVNAQQEQTTTVQSDS
ncbi:MAG: hypothetical protein ACMG6H_00455 [Acidobacteriota bacterium]